MRNLMAVLASVCLLQFKSKYLRLLLTHTTKTTLAVLASLALIEMLCKDSELPLQCRLLVTVIDIVQIFQTENITLQAVIQSPPKHLVHELRITDGVIHQMELSSKDEEVIQSAISFDNRVVVVDLNNCFLEISFNALIASLRNIVASEVELFSRLVWNLNSLLSSVIVTVPFSKIIAIVEVTSEVHEPRGKSLTALEALAFIFTWGRPWLIMENLELIFEFLIEKVLRVSQMLRFLVEVERSGNISEIYFGFHLHSCSLVCCCRNGFYITRLWRYFLLQFSISLLLLLHTLGLSFLFPFLLLSRLFLQLQPNIFLGYVRNLFKQLLDGLPRFDLLQVDSFEPLMILPHIRRLYLHLRIPQETYRRDITFKRATLALDIPIQMRQFLEDRLKHPEDLPRVDQQRQKYPDLLISHLVDPLHDEPHLAAAPKLPLKLTPVIAAILLETILIAHPLLQNLHKFSKQDSKFLVLRLLAERELVDERLGALLELLPQLGVEVQLLTLIHNYTNIKDPPSESNFPLQSRAQRQTIRKAHPRGNIPKIDGFT